VRIGRSIGTYGEGSIRDVKIFNRELTSTEIAQLARGNDLGYADEFGGAHGGMPVSATWAGGGGATVSGESSTGVTIDFTAGTYRANSNTSLFTKGKRYRIEGDASGVTATVTVTDAGGAGGLNLPITGNGHFSTEFIADGNQLRFNQVSQTDNAVAISNLAVSEIGTLADFRAEDYNESASKLLDRSSNNFVGVGTSVTLTGNQRHISADTIDLKNLPTSSAGLSAGEVWSNGGVLTVV